MTFDADWKDCTLCVDDVHIERWRLGYHYCKPCGESLAREVKHTIAPMHKSNYMLFTDLEDLKGINNKGGLYR